MSRYEVSFIIDTDMKDVGQQPWWPIIGEEPMPVDWLEYIKVRDLDHDEDVLDVEFEPDTINVVDMVYQPEPDKVKPKLELVVNNDDTETNTAEKAQPDS